MQKGYWLLCLLILLAACGGQGAAPNAEQPQLGPLDWNHDPQTIILRVDERRNDAPPYELANEIPPCTLWGDGRVVWVNELENEKQVLEAYIDDETIRKLIEDLVFSGFYDWQSNYAISDLSNPVISSITLNLYADERTVSRYDDWPVNGYQRALNACTQASNSPALVLPEGGWITAYEIGRDTTIGEWRWAPQKAGFTLAEVANGQPPRWITGDLAKHVWQNTITGGSRMQVRDGDLFYMVALQVPNIMRDAPPPR